MKSVGTLWRLLFLTFLLVASTAGIYNSILNSPTSDTMGTILGELVLPAIFIILIAAELRTARKPFRVRPKK